MPNRSYEAGVRFEKRVSAYLRDEGFFVIESRGSHGLVDQLAVKAGQLLAIQSKVAPPIAVPEFSPGLSTGLRARRVKTLARKGKP